MCRAVQMKEHPSQVFIWWTSGHICDSADLYSLDGRRWDMSMLRPYCAQYFIQWGNKWIWCSVMQYTQVFNLGTCDCMFVAHRSTLIPVRISAQCSVSPNVFLKYFTCKNTFPYIFEVSCVSPLTVCCLQLANVYSQCWLGQAIITYSWVRVPLFVIHKWAGSVTSQSPADFPNSARAKVCTGQGRTGCSGHQVFLRWASRVGPSFGPLQYQPWPL